MPRQLSFPTKQDDDATLPSTIIATREQIGSNLSEQDRRTLRLHFDVCEGDCFFFRDCPDVRRALRMDGAP